ncbi:hypothetical protein EDC04DRAFT_2665576 [Pisolithus marmoratus]|nr:hypothetical protein EDC04DRAFT_2665576 [Pisolithus marmoratus]
MHMGIAMQWLCTLPLPIFLTCVEPHDPLWTSLALLNHTRRAVTLSLMDSKHDDQFQQDLQRAIEDSRSGSSTPGAILDRVRQQPTESQRRGTFT